jgi:rSAM-associated Gly-rich repeat protein
VICIAGVKSLNITTRTGLVGFFLALSALQIPGAVAATSQPDSSTDSPQTVESRLTRLTEAIRQREPLLPKEAATSVEMLLASGGWGNGNGRGFANKTGGGGFANGTSGGFANSGGFKNGAFANGGGFRNGAFANGGGFKNGGGFYNYY